MPQPTRKLGLWLIGAGGNVATTVAVGLAALQKGLTHSVGLVTEAPPFTRLPLVGLRRIIVGGHEVGSARPLVTAQELHRGSGLFGESMLRKIAPTLRAWQANIRPGTSVGCGKAVERITRCDLGVRKRGPLEIVEGLRGDLRSFARRHKLKRLVVINVASTEPTFRKAAAHRSWSALQKPLRDGHKSPLPASSLYALAAIEEGMPYINFTPSVGADLPALRERAMEKRVPIMGSDGKTGETLIRSVLAPLFRQRQLKVLSWAGYNILGNRDGQVLASPSHRAAKLKGKNDVITSLVGDSTETRTSIEYLSSLHDWKTAWDHVHFRGFLGVKMSLQFTWQGCDSILAAPLVIDLARLADLHAHLGLAGVMTHLACFFKSPMDVREHAFAEQVRMLEQYVVKVDGRKGGDVNLRLAYSTNAYMRFDLVDALRRIAALGYRGVELMADTPHLWPADTTPHRLDEVRAELDRLGLSISNINAFMMNKIGDTRQPYWHPSWIEPDAAYRQIRIAHTKAALTMARQLGAGNITTEPGGPVGDGQSYGQAMDLFVEMLKPVVAHAEKEGVRLLVEPEPGLLIERFEQFEELADRIDSPYLGLNFDVGHAYCVGQEPSEWIDRMARHTAHYHFEDIAATRIHHHLVPGRGAMDFAETLRAIQGTEYGGWLTVELYPYVDDPDGAGREAKSHLEKIAAAL